MDTGDIIGGRAVLFRGVRERFQRGKRAKTRPAGFLTHGGIQSVTRLTERAGRACTVLLWGIVACECFRVFRLALP